jgi:hypothetical protein
MIQSPTVLVELNCVEILKVELPSRFLNLKCGNLKKSFTNDLFRCIFCFFSFWFEVIVWKENLVPHKHTRALFFVWLFGCTYIKFEVWKILGILLFRSLIYFFRIFTPSYSNCSPSFIILIIFSSFFCKRSIQFFLIMTPFCLSKLERTKTSERKIKQTAYL